MNWILGGGVVKRVCLRERAHLIRILSIFAYVFLFLSFLVLRHTEHIFVFFFISFFSLLIFNSHIFNLHLERLCSGPLHCNKLMGGRPCCQTHYLGDLGLFQHSPSHAGQTNFMDGHATWTDTWMNYI